MSKSKSKSLSERLAELANPTPKFADPEDEYNEESKAQLEAFEDEDHAKEVFQSKKLKSKVSLRKKNIELLSASDKRYAGKRVSRKDLEESSEEDLSSGSGDESLGKNDSSEDVEEDGSMEEEEDDEDEDVDDISTFKTNFMKKVNGNAEPSKNTKVKTLLQDDSDMLSTDEDQEAGDMDESLEEEEDEDGSLDEEDTEGEDYDEDVDDEEASIEDEEDDVENVQSKKEDNQKSVTSYDEDIKKGKSIQNQLSLWDHLLECRIKLHKGINLANQLPKASDFKQFSKVAGENHFLTASQAAQSSLKTLLDNCLELQNLLYKSNPQTKFLLQKGTNGTKPDLSDEEIPSDTEDEIESDEEEGEENGAPKAKKLKVAEYDKELGERHENYRPFCHRTLNMWSEKTKLASGRTGSGPKSGFGAFDQSILKQIEGILADKQRLINRTRIKRSNYRILGCVPKPPVVNTSKEGESVEDGAPSTTKATDFEEFEPEIYDDDDFYHQLLRELIEKRTGEAGSGQVALGKQWLEIQKLRSKAKRKVDAKASKGRRLRYQVHPKLVSFMAPYPETTWNDIAKNELFASLFGSGAGKSVN